MQRSPYLALLAAVLCISVASLLVRAAAAPALAVAFYRVALAALVVLPFAARGARPRLGALGGRRALALLAAGLGLALHFATWIASLAYTSIAASTLLVNTTPLWSAGLARVLLHERVPRAVAPAALVALSGAALISWGDWRQGPDPLRGDLLALAGAASLAVYHVAGRGLRDALPLRLHLVAVWSGAALVLLALALLGGTPLRGYAPRTWAAFVGLALVPTLGGHGLVNLALRALPAPVVGLFLLGEPLGATLLGWLVLGERPGAWTLAGGALVLAALARLTRPDRA